MTDIPTFLDTIVETSHINNQDFTTNLLLKGKDGYDTVFVLPLRCNFQPGDRIEFYKAIKASPLTHSDYLHARVYRGEEMQLAFDSRQMRVLTELNAAERRS